MKQSVLDRFIPDQYFDDPARYNKAKLLVGTSFALIITALVFSLNNFLLDQSVVAIAILLSIPVFSIPSLFILKLSKSSKVAPFWLTTGVFVIVILITFLQGGLQVIAAWACLVPVLAVLLGNIRSGLFWATMSLIFISVLYYLEQTEGYDFSVIGLTPNQERFSRFFGLIGLVTVLTACTILFESFKDKAFQQFSEMTENVQGSAKQLFERTESQSSKVIESVGSLRELSDTIQDVAQNAQKVSTIAYDSAKQATSGKVAVESAGQAMGRIRESSDQIADIIAIISDIAEQTNLLALNAAIEAARAAQHGQGFAVVADEVRKLADRSAKATLEITTLIKESRGRVTEGERLSEEAGIALGVIVDLVNRTADMIEQISAATEEQTATADNIKQNMDDIENMVNKNAEFAKELSNQKLLL